MLDSTDFNQEKEQALKVVRRLKESGWSFACHGYGHLHASKASLERLEKDTLRWKSEVGALVGNTVIYIYPYGEEVPSKDPKFEMLMDSGFSIFCAVGGKDFCKTYEGYVRMDRANIDGTAFYYRKEGLSDMFNVEEIIDKARPPLDFDEK